LVKRSVLLPRPIPSQFQIERPAEERSNQDNDGKDAHAGKGELNRDRPHDIRSDQEFET
jgi:hypothetical protein